MRCIYEKTIKGIYRQDTFYIEKCGMNNKELIELEKQKSALQRKMSECFNKEIKELLCEYENLLFEIADQYNEEYFAKGFELGAKIATEVFYK